MIIFLLAFLIHYFYRPQILKVNINNNFQIKEVLNSGFIIKVKNQLVFIKSYNKYNIGDIVKIKGFVQETSGHLQNYLYAKNVINIIWKPNINLIFKINNLRTIIQNFILEGPLYYKKITPLLLLGKKTAFTYELYNLSIQMNIAHLFVISGFHVSLFFLFIKYLLTKLKINSKIFSFIAIMIIIFYLYILNFPLSALRAFLFILLLIINKEFFKSKFHNLNILTLVMVLMFLINPRSIFSFSFILTFLATYSILFIINLKIKNIFWKYIMFLIIPWLSNIFIIIYINKYFSFLALFYNFIFTPLIGFMYVLSFILLPFKFLLDKLNFLFLFIIKIISKTNFLIYFPNFSLIYVYLFYLILWSWFIILLIWNSFMEAKII